MKHKILIVDDEKKIRSLYGRLLKGEGYEVIEAGNSQSATDALLHAQDIDVVLLDINMPVVPGTILYDLIRRFDPRIKVIVVSAYPLDDQKRYIVNADDYYDKSQGTEVLLDKIRSLTKEINA